MYKLYCLEKDNKEEIRIRSSWYNRGTIPVLKFAVLLQYCSLWIDAFRHYSTVIMLT